MSTACTATWRSTSTDGFRKTRVTHRRPRPSHWSGRERIDGIRWEWEGQHGFIALTRVRQTRTGVRTDGHDGDRPSVEKIFPEPDRALPQRGLVGVPKRGDVEGENPHLRCLYDPKDVWQGRTGQAGWKNVRLRGPWNLTVPRARTPESRRFAGIDQRSQGRRGTFGRARCVPGVGRVGPPVTACATIAGRPVLGGLDAIPGAQPGGVRRPGGTPGPRPRAVAGGPCALTRWCVARGGGVMRCAGWPGASARGAPAPAAPDRRRVGRRPRAVPARE